MSNESASIVQRVWNYCNVLRDDGVSYGDYVEQLTYLLFLKMADEQTKPPFNKPSTIPKGFDWQSLISKDGTELEIHYRQLLEVFRQRKRNARRHLPQSPKQNSRPSQTQTTT